MKITSPVVRFILAMLMVVSGAGCLWLAFWVRRVGQVFGGNLDAAFFIGIAGIVLVVWGFRIGCNHED